MKARIFIDGSEVFTSNKISEGNLQKKAREIKAKYGCFKIEEQVERGFAIFRRY